MANLCEQSPIPIALDEELIGISGVKNKETLLASVNPHFVVLKPTLLGGFQDCLEWINAAEKQDIGWWVTSALESNIGLNAIAQFTSTFSTNMFQGLGTGSLYHNNIPSPLFVENGFLGYKPSENWDLGYILN